MIEKGRYVKYNSFVLHFLSNILYSTNNLLLVNNRSLRDHLALTTSECLLPFPICLFAPFFF